MSFEKSFGLTGMGREIAASSSEDAEIAALEQELGVVDSRGNDQTPTGQEERAKARTAQVEKLNGFIEKSKQPPPAPAAPEGAPADPAAAKKAQLKKEFDEAPINQVVGGVADAVQSVANLGIDFADWVDNKFGNGKFVPDDLELNFADNWYPPKSTSDKLLRSASQFLIPYAGASKIVQAAGIAKGAVATGAIAGIATDFLAFDGDEERLSNLVQEVPELSNPVTEFLMAKPTDTEAEGRLKNVLEGIGFGIATEGIFRGIKYLRGKKTAVEAIKMADDIQIGKIKPTEGKIDVNLEGQAKIETDLPQVPDAVTQAQKDAADDASNNFSPSERTLPPGYEVLDRIGMSENGYSILDPEMLSLLEAAETPEARAALMKKFGFSDADAELVKQFNPTKNQKIEAGAFDNYNAEGLAKEGLLPENVKVLSRGRKQLKPMEPAAALKPNASPAKGGGAQVNLEKIDEAPDTLDVIKNVSENDRAALEQNIPDSIHSEIKGAPLVPLEDLFKKPSGELLSEKELYSARVYLAGSARKTKELALQAQRTGAHADKVAALQALEATRQINFLVTEAKARPAQILNSLKIKVKGEDSIQAFLQIHGEKNVDRMLTQLAQLPESAVVQVANKSYRKRLGDAVFETYVNNLLVNPATHVVNFASNFATALWATTERAFAPFMKAGKMIDPQQVKDALARQKTLMSIDTSKLSFEELMQHKADLAATNNVAKQALQAGVAKGEFLEAGVAQMKAFANEALSSFSGFVDGISMLWKSAKQGDAKTISQLADEAAVDPFTKMEGIPPAITSDNLGGGPLVDILGGLQRLPSKGLAWADNFWKAVNYRGEIHALAYRLAEAQNLAGDEFTKFIKEYVTNPPDYIDALAKKRANINTFTNPVDDEFSKRLSAIIDADDPLGVQLPVAPLKFIIPFKRTQLNIQKFALDRTPLALISNQYKEALARGGADAQMARAQMALGTSVIGGVALMVGNGTVTGSGPADTRTRKLLTDSGWRPYSVRVGDQYIELKKFAPIGEIVSIVADLGEIAGHIGEDISVEDAQQLGGLIAWTAIKRFTPEMMVDNFGEFFEAIRSGDVSRLTSDIAAKSVPLAGHANVVRKMEDPVYRVTKADPNDPMPWLAEVVNKVKNQIPGYSKDLPPRLNIWGDPVTYPVGVGAQIASPFIGSKFDAKDPVTSELVRLGYAGAVVRASPPNGETHLAVTMPPKKFAMEGGSVDLDPVKYNRFVELSAGKGLKYIDKPLKETLADLIKSNYADIGFEKHKTDQNKRIVIKKIIQDYRNAAKAQMLEEFPELENDLTASIEAIKKARGME